ncbi:MAG: hypothetical protein ACFFDT_05975 [Candidatus Hodarchaeota archaeon]
MINPEFDSSISKKLLEIQYNSTNPALFEETLADAFTILGFESKHIGGPNEPDIILKSVSDTIVIEAKTSKDGVIGETTINFDALDRHATERKAKYKGVIGPKFRSGNLIDSAKKHDVKLITTEALCQIIELHLTDSFSTKELVDLMFETEVNILTPDIVISYLTPESDLVNGSIWILGYLMKLELGQSISTQKFKTLHEFHGADFTWQEIYDSLEFLASPPIAFISKSNSNYSLNGDFEEIAEKVGILQRAIKELKIIDKDAWKENKIPSLPISRPLNETDKYEGEKRVYAGNFRHIGSGIFVLKSDTSVKLDLNKSIGNLRKQMRDQGLRCKNMGGFQYQLRVKANIIRTEERS